jgi:hypothetical protein
VQALLEPIETGLKSFALLRFFRRSQRMMKDERGNEFLGRGVAGSSTDQVTRHFPFV